MTHPGATPSNKHKVVISGFGGLNAAKKLKRADVDIKLIAKTTHHLFQPLLYQVATGIISEGEIAPPTRVILRKQKNCQVLLGEVTNVDLAGRFVDSVLLGHTRNAAPSCSPSWWWAPVRPVWRWPVRSPNWPTTHSRARSVASTPPARG